MNAGGPPPPPPPPPIPGVLPSSRLPSEIPSRPAMNTPPAALASAMMKDRKPFTYTPGGLDLSEISNQPNQNGDSVDQAPNSEDFGPPVQSRSFRVLQNVLDHHDTADDPTSGVPMKVEVPLVAPRPYSPHQSGPKGFASYSAQDKRGSFSYQNGQKDSTSQIVDAKSGQRGQIPQGTNEKRGSFSGRGAGGPRGSVSQAFNERRGSFQQQNGGGKRGSVPSLDKNQVPFSRPNGYRGSVGNIRNTINQENNVRGVPPHNDGLKIVQHSVGGVSKIILGQNGESEPMSPDSKELSNIFKNQVRVSANTDEARTRGGHFHKENLNSEPKTEPQGPIHIPAMRPNQQAPGQYQPPPYQQQPTYQQQSGVNNIAASTEQSIPEPKKYMGSSIPSRSFRMLQAMTGTDDTTDAGEPANTSESSGQPDDDTQHTANQNPSPNIKSSIPNSPSSSSLSPLTQVESHDISSDSGISSPSKIGSYTNGKDNKVYRHVSPKIIFTGSKERIVNSALSNSREPSSPTWKTANFQPSQSFTPINQSSTDANDKTDQESPRLMKIVREDSASPNPQNVERRYEGGYIPSRVFRHLQSEYPSGDPNELQEPKPRFGSKSPSPRFEGGGIPPRVLKSIQNEANTSFESDATDGDASRTSSSLAELDEYYHNGMANRTAVSKDTVLKELTSQFDHTGIRKKPKAAPGRVFRYLQSQYDTPEDSAEEQNSQPAKDTLKPEPEDVGPGFGYRGAKVPSPSFKFLQSQYDPEQDGQQPISQEPVYPDTPELKEEPLPYRGCRVPGRTFRSLQGDVTNHPSVFGARK